MTDIVERLRRGSDDNWSDATMYEAADEIERLREALIMLRDLPVEENDQPNTLILDGERMQGPSVDWTFIVIRKIKEVASAALNPGE